MTTTHTRTKFAVVVGAAIAGAAAPALLFLGAGTAHAIQALSEGVFAPVPAVQDVSDVIDPGSRVGILDPGSKVGIIDPGSRVGIIDPGLKVGIGGPDTRPAP
jgi:hypothetical protein